MPTLEAGPSYKSSSEMGNAYGFPSLAHVLGKERVTKRPLPESIKGDLSVREAELARVLAMVQGAGVVPELGKPLFFSHTDMRPGGPVAKNSLISLVALGAGRPLSDVVLMRAARSVVHELTGELPAVRVNSMGDRESLTRYERALMKFFRDHLGLFSESVAQAARKSPLRAATLLLEEETELELPRSVDYLSEQSRKYFEKVLEILEKTDTAYELDHTLITHEPTWQETLFSFGEKEDAVRASGARFQDFAKHFYKSLALPSMSALIEISFAKRDTLPKVRLSKKPQFVFVHIGDRAKHESIKLADSLHKARLPLVQYLALESLTEQMERAKLLNPRYIILLGEREVAGGYATLRRCEDYSEQQIPLDKLIGKLTTLAR